MSEMYSPVKIRMVCLAVYIKTFGKIQVHKLMPILVEYLLLDEWFMKFFWQFIEEVKELMTVY
jgi:hypothetical protein